MRKTILINKDNHIKDSFYKRVKFITIKDIENNDIQIEEETYNSYLKLYEFLKSININIGIESAYRSLENQKETYIKYVELYGKEYADKFVAPVGASEHHTGLAIDISVKVNDKYNTNDIQPEEEVLFEEIHTHLKDYGFILRYPKGKEVITGYPYEPWHIRYVGEFVANIIYKNKITLEEYLTNYSGVLLIDKEKNMTSFDVVNKISSMYGIKKVGHTGTLDPIATGVLVVCVGNATKLVDILTSKDKEYIASVELGTLTDTLDNTGNILKDEKCIKTKEEIIEVLNNFKGKYLQEVPIYSAVKINGKKLYEYAREGIEINLPKREVEISNIELLGDIEIKNNKTIFKFKCSVSKGTYIRSLIRDIASKLNTVGIMTDLRRIRQGKFNIENCVKVDNIKEDSLVDIIDILDCKKIELSNNIEKQVLNGASIDNVYNCEEVLFIRNNEAISLYKKSEKDNRKLKPYKVFKGGIL